MDGAPYLLLKARADQIPLPDNSVKLVIGTPPEFGIKNRPRADYCTCNLEEYHVLIKKFLGEAMRIVQPHGHILLSGSGLQGRGSRGARAIIFHVLRKQVSHGHWIQRQVGSETFSTHFVKVRGFPWWALSLQLYRDLIAQYSRPGEIVVHVFSGSGNGAIAAIELGRKPILIDLHYHHQVGNRLRKRVASLAPTIVPSSARLFS